ncbi:hypothetical protein PAPYR_9905 [Paratrimastix pyriformis]|uniref:Uncharacterized protein n=1 Tax=Paratrimastix pyriformis TaxID=342808 RepID=A0ABQ8U778_9EUKA|nr:hypothetical protein PAPYR_9905 [Paratrimastix pyriformis]
MDRFLPPVPDAGPAEPLWEDEPQPPRAVKCGKNFLVELNFTFRANRPGRVDLHLIYCRGRDVPVTVDTSTLATYRTVLDRHFVIPVVVE